MTPMRWQDVDPLLTRGIDLTKRDDITAPHNEKGERCAWPWGPQLLDQEPIGAYRCIFCGAPVVAGKEHPDYTDGQYAATPISAE